MLFSLDSDVHVSLSASDCASSFISFLLQDGEFFEKPAEAITSLPLSIFSIVFNTSNLGVGRSWDEALIVNRVHQLAHTNDVAG